MDQAEQVDVDKRDSAGNTPLHLAAQAGHLGTVRHLLVLTTHVNQKNHNGETPLHMATEKGRYNVAKMLLEAGADPSVQDNNGATPSHLAAAGGYIDVMELLSKRDAMEMETDTVMNLSANSDCPKLKTLLKFVDSSDDEECPEERESRTPEDASEEIYEDPNIVIRDMFAEEPEHTLEKYIVKSVKKEVSEAKEYQNAKYAGAYTPLHMALRYRSGNAACEFIDHNANVDVTTASGVPAMILAASGGSLKAIKKMEAAGAHFKHRHLGVTPMYAASYFGHESTVRYLNRRGLDVNAKARLGETPLHLATKFGNLRLARTLLQLGADRNARDNRGATPLMLAVVKRDKEMIELLQKG